MSRGTNIFGLLVQEEKNGEELPKKKAKPKGGTESDVKASLGAWVKKAQLHRKGGGENSRMSTSGQTSQTNGRKRRERNTGEETVEHEKGRKDCRTKKKVQNPDPANKTRRVTARTRTPYQTEKQYTVPKRVQGGGEKEPEK